MSKDTKITKKSNSRAIGEVNPVIISFPVPPLSVEFRPLIRKITLSDIK